MDSGSAWAPLLGDLNKIPFSALWKSTIQNNCRNQTARLDSIRPEDSRQSDNRTGEGDRESLTLLGGPKASTRLDTWAVAAMRRFSF